MDSLVAELSRDPKTRSASPFMTGASRRGSASNSYVPSASAITQYVDSVYSKPVRRAAP